ncbi:MAG: Zn-ribbon domain-containing OB-fold protein [Pseudomonadota bacterium]|nr:Zn-ribbon domain-containing OB-fold protein [Pseudomonadota bacterium]MBU1569046.1 Zn-ribbon domain-containing OB-fold protein [Pseudomonadota bacterium]
MTDIFSGVEPMVFKSGINVPYSWWAGETAERFFLALRDDKKIMGTRCPVCEKVFVPPRKVCPLCFHENMAWVEVSSEGVLESFTIVKRQLASLPRKAPVVFGLIRLDKADTSILHYIEVADHKDIKIGMRVAAEFIDERSGSIQDIACFRPVR